MLYKQRYMTDELKAYLALEKRLPPDHALYPTIYQEMYKLRAGFGGEQEYDRYMKEVLTDYPHAILHDLSLQQEGIYFQLDSLFIAPDVLIITEIKNRTGKITIKADPVQFIQTAKHSEPILFRSPIAELERKQQLLERWLQKRGIRIPIQGIIVFAHNNELQFAEKPGIPIMTGYEAPIYFRGRKPGPDILDKRAIERLAAALHRENKPFKPSPLSARYRITKEDLIPGVWCPCCSEKNVMLWHNKRWSCRSCGNTSQTEHETALNEWFLIISPQITNKSFCTFTNLPDRHTAKRLLARSAIYRKGKRAGSVYVPLKKHR